MTRGEMLRDAMARAGMNRAELAQAIDVCPSAIGRWLNDDRRPSPPVARRIEHALGIDLGVDVVRLHYIEIPGKVARRLQERYAGWTLREALEAEIKEM